jgi:hypothetical protein
MPSRITSDAISQPSARSGMRDQVDAKLAARPYPAPLTSRCIWFDEASRGTSWKGTSWSRVVSISVLPRRAM